MKPMTFALAGLALAGLSACNQKSAAWREVETDIPALEKKIEDLRTRAFTLKAEGAADIAAVIAALPGEVKVAYGDLSFDAAAGATVLTDVRITPAADPEMGVSVERLAIWGLDTELAVARLKGERLDESAQLFARADLKAVSLFGLEKLFNPAMEAYVDGVESVVEGLTPDGTEIPDTALQAAFNSYSFNIEQVIFDDVIVRPWVLEPKTLEADNPFAQAMPFIQTAVAFTRSFGIARYAFVDSSGSIDMDVPDSDIRASFRVGLMAASGTRGSDVDASLTRDMTYDLDMTMPSEVPDAPPVNMRMAGSADRYEITGVKLDKLAGYLARGVMPPRTETDLLSLGKWRVVGETASLGGSQIYAVAETNMDLSGFHWFIPTHLSGKSMGVRYDLKGLMDWAMTIAASEQTDAAEIEQVRKGMLILERHGLSTLDMDVAYGWDWNPKSGGSEATLSWGVKDFGRFDMAADGATPSFAAVSALVPDDIGQTDGDAMAELFRQKMVIRSAGVTLEDKGGLDKTFALVRDMTAEFTPPGQPGDLSGMSPQQLRQMSFNGVFALAPEADKMSKRLGDVVRAFGKFVQEGGSVSVTIAPAKGATVQELSEITEPAAAVDRLDLKASHVTPAPVK
jgi:hypothetical protein